MAKRKGPSRREIVERNQHTSLSSLARTSGSMKSAIAWAKQKSPFAVAHVPGQATKEFKGVVRTGNTFRKSGVGTFKG